MLLLHELLLALQSATSQQRLLAEEEYILFRGDVASAFLKTAHYSMICDGKTIFCTCNVQITSFGMPDQSPFPFES